MCYSVREKFGEHMVSKPSPLNLSTGATAIFSTASNNTTPINHMPITVSPDTIFGFGRNMTDLFVQHFEFVSSHYERWFKTSQSYNALMEYLKKPGYDVYIEIGIFNGPVGDLDIDLVLRVLKLIDTKTWTPDVDYYANERDLGDAGYVYRYRIINTEYERLRDPILIMYVPNEDDGDE